MSRDNNKMKVSLTVLVLYMSTLCIYAANLQQVDLAQEGEASNIIFVTPNVGKADPRRGNMLKEDELVCPDGPPTSPNAPLRERAICPWTFKITRDDKRIPVFMKEAVCLCKECSKIGTCIPVYTNSLTLRKVANNRSVIEKLKIAVACQCIPHLL